MPGMRLRTLLRLYSLLLERLCPPEREWGEEKGEEGGGGGEEKSRRSASVCLKRMAAAVGSALAVCLPSEQELGLFLNRHTLQVLT